jgi:hypothetical protein
LDAEVARGKFIDNAAAKVTRPSSPSGPGIVDALTGIAFNRPGRLGCKFTDDEKSAIVEYLKSATYEDYPTTSVQRDDPPPCADKPDWAKGLAVQ